MGPMKGDLPMDRERVRMIVDVDRCWGCFACEVACKQAQNLEVGFSPMKVIEVGPRRIEDSLQRDFVPTMCQHCDRALCMESCPTDAIHREDDGTVQIEGSKCIGCGKCKRACPYGVMGGDKNRKAIKCNLCMERRSLGQLPSCVQHCPGGALSLVSEGELKAMVDGRYTWSVGSILYASDKWVNLGEKVGQEDGN